jgi:hypothetical protein
MDSSFKQFDAEKAVPVQDLIKQLMHTGLDLLE